MRERAHPFISFSLSVCMSMCLYLCLGKKHLYLLCMHTHIVLMLPKHPIDSCLTLCANHQTVFTCHIKCLHDFQPDCSFPRLRQWHHVTPIFRCPTLAESALPLIHPPSFGFRPVCLGTRSGNLMQIVVNLSNTKHLTNLANIRSTREKWATSFAICTWRTFMCCLWLICNHFKTCQSQRARDPQLVGFETDEPCGGQNALFFGWFNINTQL